MNLQPVNRIYKISVLQDSRNAAVAASLNNRMSQVAASTKSVTNNARGAALATRNLGYVAQNASYQIADFFVMLQGGVGIGRALSTQLPQLLAGFGSLGAVLGAAAAIGATLVVMLQEANKVQVDVTEVTENYEKALTEANSALVEFVKTGEAGTRTMNEFYQASLRVATADLVESLTPPPASAWDGYLAGVLRTLQIIGNAIASIPGIDLIVDGIGEGLSKLNEYYREYGSISQSYDNAIYSFINALARAQLGTEKFLQAFRLLNSEVSEQYGKLAQPIQSTGFPIFDDAKAAFDLVITALTELEGTADQSKWGELAVRQAELFKKNLDAAESAIKEFRSEYARLTERTEDGKLLSELFIQSDLDRAVKSWTDAMQSGLVTTNLAKEAIESLVEIDRWKPLQDIILDIGKKFEDSIIQAMKTGKFAVSDFVKFALEELARLYLSRIFTGLFQAFANFLPTFGTGGSPSTNVGRPPGIRSAAIEAPESAAPFYNYGQSISRVPGGARAVGSTQGSNVTVNVNNYGNDDVEVKQAETSNGIEIDVIIKNTVRNALGDGSFDKVMASSFGARRLGY